MSEDQATPPPERYRVNVPLRWSDMDAYGHVNNVQFLRLLEDARGIGFQEWFGQERSMLDQGVLVARHEIEYLAPLEFRHAPMAVDMWATRISGASFVDRSPSVIARCSLPVACSTKACSVNCAHGVGRVHDVT